MADLFAFVNPKQKKVVVKSKDGHIHSTHDYKGGRRQGRKKIAEVAFELGARTS